MTLTREELHVLDIAGRTCQTHEQDDGWHLVLAADPNYVGRWLTIFRARSYEEARAFICGYQFDTAS